MDQRKHVTRHLFICHFSPFDDNHCARDCGLEKAH